MRTSFSESFTTPTREDCASSDDLQKTRIHAPGKSNAASYDPEQGRVRKLWRLSMKLNVLVLEDIRRPKIRFCTFPRQKKKIKTAPPDIDLSFWPLFYLLNRSSE